ncbi:MAG: hypothetical protein PF637_13245 [Spirochaetes bacterium]|jgi:Na+-transporting methylmalonyl-CoA/oxaloacetate decarboxylase gamma subunit|nr:hypothetical protein [Spirochaetota bacterium]
MSGFGDLSVTLAILFTLLSLLLCVIYGVVKWNQGGEITPDEADKEKHWDEEEDHINTELDVKGGNE